MTIAEVPSAVLRDAEPEDLMFYFGLRNEPAVRASARETKPLDLATHRRWFAEKIADSNAHLTVVVAGGEPIGQVRIDVRGERGEVDIAIVPEHRGRGYGAWAIGEACRLVFTRVPALRAIFGYIREGNIASRQSFTKAGFTECGPVSYRGESGWIEAVLTRPTDVRP